MPQPHILLIQADQHRYDCLGVNGHPLVRTPHLDRLAAQGVNFTHAFCPAPVCVPSRNSLLYGQWATAHGAIANYPGEAPVPPPAPGERLSFSRVLRDAGYWLGLVGQWHIHPHISPQDEGFHEYIPEGAYEPWRSAQGLPPRPRTNRWFGEPDPAAAPEQSRLAWGADRVIGMLERAAATGKPFFIRWDPSEPHLPNIVPEPYASMYPPAAIAPWPSFPDPLTGKPYIQAQQRRTWQLDHWTWADWAPIVARYLGEITLFDTQVGRLLAALERLGLAENTMVVYTSDHGDFCGGHGMIDKHFAMYDDVTRVPLIVRWPGQARAGHTCPAFVSHGLDLARTFCEAAGAEAPKTFQGESLLPLLQGAPENGRSFICATYHGSQFGLYSQRMLRERRWKYVWNPTAEDELYDLEGDPGEVHNRAADPACAGDLARLRRALVAWMEETRDPLLNLWTRTQLLEGLKI